MGFFDFNLDSPIIRTSYWIIMVIIGIANYRIRNNLKSKVSLVYLVNQVKSFYSNANKIVDGEDFSFLVGREDKYHIWYKATIKNNGNTDIDKTSIHSPLIIILPNQYTFLKVIAKPSNSQIEVKFEYSEKKVTIYWDLIKVEEFLTFEALIEYNPFEKEKYRGFNYEKMTLNIKEKLLISYRISNLSIIKMFDDPFNKTVDYSKNISNIMFNSLLCINFLYMAPLSHHSETNLVDIFLSYSSYILGISYGLYVLYTLMKLLRHKYKRPLGKY